MPALQLLFFILPCLLNRNTKLLAVCTIVFLSVHCFICPHFNIVGFAGCKTGYCFTDPGIAGYRHPFCHRTKIVISGKSNFVTAAALFFPFHLNFSGLGRPYNGNLRLSRNNFKCSGQSSFITTDAGHRYFGCSDIDIIAINNFEIPVLYQISKGNFRLLGFTVIYITAGKKLYGTAEFFLIHNDWYGFNCCFVVGGFCSINGNSGTAWSFYRNRSVRRNGNH